MAALPIGILFIWLSGLLAFGLVGGGAYALRVWYLHSWVYDPVLDQTLFLLGIGINSHTALLGLGLFLLLWALLGGLFVRLFMSLLHRTRSGDTPRRTHSQDVERIKRPDGVRCMLNATARPMASLLSPSMDGALTAPSGIISNST